MSGCPEDTGIDCDEALAMLYQYLDEEVRTPEDMRRLHEHFHRCTPCIAEHDVVVKIQDMVRQACCEQAPQLLHERVMEAIRATCTERSPGGDDGPAGAEPA